MTSLAVDLPQEVVERLAPTPADAVRCLQELALIDLFRRGEVSSGWAAEKLGIGKWDFIKLLGEHKVPYIDMTREELLSDIEVAKSIWQRRAASESPITDR